MAGPFGNVSGTSAGGEGKNNPLAGIMAEAQLMQLESPTADQAAALERMVALCRRMIELTRTLDGVAERKLLG